MELGGCGESPEPDEEDLACKQAAINIRDSMEKCKEFWGDLHYKNLNIIPAYLLKCPPYKTGLNVRLASEVAEIIWRRMSQIDIEEFSRINAILLQNGEIASDEVIPPITCILNKILEPERVRDILIKISCDDQEAILLIGNQILFLFNETVSPSITEAGGS